MKVLANILVSLGPVFAFLGILLLLDSFKLVKIGRVVKTILAGCAVAIVCFVINRTVLTRGWMELSAYSKFVAPAVEETMKALYVVYLLKKKRVGFMVDSAILGFAVGAGFAFVENIYYLQTVGHASLATWIIRGFGTAVMHGGTTSIFAVVSKTLCERYGNEPLKVFLPGLGVAVGIHILFNQFLLPPEINTVVQLVLLPLLMVFTFSQSERSLRDWLEVGLDTDVSILDSITSGKVSETKVGEYLTALKERFQGPEVADMLNMLRIHLELAIRAKGILLMRESGFKPPQDPEIAERFAELKYLEESIGRTGMLAISPILHNSSRDLWQIYMLKSG